MKQNNQANDWIEDWAKASYQLVEGNVLEAFAPIDFYHFYPLFFDLWFAKIFHAIKLIEQKQIPREDVLKSLPVPSSIRGIIFKLIAVLPYIEIDPTIVKKVLKFFFDVLDEVNITDPFATSENLVHDEWELGKIINDSAWEPANPEIAKKIARLYTSCLSLCHGLYNDITTDNAIDIYAPYPVKYQGKNYSLVIRHFPDLKTSELWGKDDTQPVEELIFYQLYHPVTIKIPWLGCHMMMEGSPIELLQEYAIIADGDKLNEKGISDLTEKIVAKTIAIYEKVKSMDFEGLKRKVIEQENYQLINLFKLVGMDWQPEQNMFEAVNNKPLTKGLFILGKILTFEEYKQQFGINKLKKIYQDK